MHKEPETDVEALDDESDCDEQPRHQSIYFCDDTASVPTQGLRMRAQPAYDDSQYYAESAPPTPKMPMNNELDPTTAHETFMMGLLRLADSINEGARQEYQVEVSDYGTYRPTRTRGIEYTQ